MATSRLAASRASTDWFSRDLIEILPAAVYVCDADAVVVAYNKRAGELWGREPKPGDTDEKYCGAHRLYLPDGTFMPHHETPMESVLRTGEPARNMEVVIERPDGSRVTVLVNIAPLFGKDGRLVGAVNCFQDLTAQKKAESERAQLEQELHQAQKVEALGQLTAGISHDFNNLLTAVLANLDLVKDRVADPHALKLLANAMRAAERGAALNQQLLAFARKQTLVPQAVQLDEVLTRMESLLRTTIGDTIRLDMRSSAETWPVLVDPNQIALVILNLAINARDAMPQGGTLVIETRNAAMSATDHPGDLSDGDYVILSMSDTGVGMTEEVRAKAFEPFFTTKEMGKGSGLGLSMALGVAEQSGGRIEINSRPGEGTSIEIYLPRAGQEVSSATLATTPSAGSFAGNGEVVVVVDDDSDVREATAAILAGSGYRVIEAGNGLAALEILKNATRVDLMIVDVAMPELNGVETARRARDLRPDLAVLFSSGYADVANFADYDVDRGHIVAKPYHRHALLEKIHACLGSHSPAAHARRLPSQVESSGRSATSQT